MRNDPALIKTIKKGSIVQIDPKAELGFEGAGCFAVVAAKHGWGVDAIIVGRENDGGRALSWPVVEPTGGVAIWGSDGERLPTGEPLRHHP